MPRKYLKRLLPDPAKLRKRRELRFLGKLLDDPYLLHLNRRSVAGGVALGVFVALIPLPFQMVIAAALAIWLRVNLVIAVASVWISNPLTMPPLLFFCYRVGTVLMGRPVREQHFTPSLEWFWAELGLIWKPLYLGSCVVAVVASLASYLAVHLLWRLFIVRELRRRRLKAQHAKQQASDKQEP
ncbi:hypothetical protein CAI21_21205 [Alkalilimnicola ehrlichii]|uniref:DUF2062 domain-containing protein n=1 Tax=Alkalilimnicola ehrlichii TaxID=351052 RepID=A0A3E0WMY5_9GAMM|nr:DUF2062 domain-containing protein [Alkalilimnicola ehrlichii]RFA24555.1 hypothetical protein CAI21_21205 [Alkalilimnicola ehrlichii]RFA33779.1 hypothetical protein CAL65_16720 [Alkalilimnicola ehrlichii]